MYYDDSGFESNGFDTPALAYLEYSDFARKKYTILNLSSRVEAKLDICVHGDGLSNPTNLFNGFKNVEILSVTDETLELIHTFREVIPAFENLSHLSLVTEKQFCWFGLRVLLQKLPKLKALTVKGSWHRNEDGRFVPLCECLLRYSFLLTSRIEVFKITEFEGYTGEMLQLKDVLENLPCLELLEVHVQANTKSGRIKIKKDLLKIPRASKCKIKVKFS